MSEWWDALERESEPSDEQKAARLVNLLSRLPGSRELKLEWLTRNMALIEAEAERADPPTARAHAGAVKAIAFRFYRRWAKDKGLRERSGPAVELLRRDLRMVR